LDTADLIDESDKGGKVDLGVIVDWYADELFYRLNRQRRTAAGQLISIAQVICGVDPGVFKAWNADL
jgi:hypothetical protein